MVEHIVNICSDCLAESRDFYVTLLGCRVTYDSPHYIQLATPAQPDLELGIIRRDHELVPARCQAQPTGIYIPLVIPDIDVVYAKATARRLEILKPPQKNPYERRFLIVDPNSCVLDISSSAPVAA